MAQACGVRRTPAGMLSTATFAVRRDTRYLAIEGESRKRARYWDIRRASARNISLARRRAYFVQEIATRVVHWPGGHEQIIFLRLKNVGVKRILDKEYLATESRDTTATGAQVERATFRTFDARTFAAIRESHMCVC